MAIILGICSIHPHKNALFLLDSGAVAVRHFVHEKNRAKKVAELHIDYRGKWNEDDYSTTFGSSSQNTISHLEAKVEKKNRLA